MEKALTIVGVVISVFVSVGGFLWAYFIGLVQLRERLTAVETKIEVFWGVVTDNIKGLLKHPTELRKDELLDKLPKLNEFEAVELKEILKEDLHRANDKTDKLIYALVLARTEIIIHDLKQKGKNI